VTGGPPLTEAEHFWKCEACGGWFDMARSRRGARSRGAVAASGVRSSAVDHARQGPGGIAERAVHRGRGIGARQWRGSQRRRRNQAREMSGLQTMVR
jgi:hypothetical protein